MIAACLTGCRTSALPLDPGQAPSSTPTPTPTPTPTSTPPPDLFPHDPRAAALALDLFTRTGDTLALEPEQHMDGGWRGPLHLVPQLPAGPYLRHLEWVRASAVDHDAFFTALSQAAPHDIHYRWRPITFSFFRSVGGHRPSAWALGWTLSYNVEGSLNLNADAVRETLFHEVFHLNDAAHGDWSVSALGSLYAGIVARCGTRVECLTPVAPNSTRVRGGTYYAFQPNNGEGVHEYAAELAVRFYREQRAALASKPLANAPFKCGPGENRRAWQLIVEEFFGGFDRVPGC